jgi:hypothetical protein
MARERTIIIRNNSRSVLWFSLDTETHQKAQAAGVHNVHLEEPLFCLGDVNAHPSENPPQVEAPEWFWKALRDGDGPQAKAVKAWINKGTIVAMAKAA